MKITSNVVGGVALLLLCTIWICPTVLAEEGSGVLFDDDEVAIVEYLETHRIPHMEIPGLTGGPLPDDPSLSPVLDRTLTLFKRGSPKLRLAIAKSLWSYSLQKAMEFWDACEKEDYEAKHHLVGLALVKASREERKSIRAWLLGEAHPSYATALLRNLNASSLYADLDDAHRNAFLPFLERLYGQQGTVTPLKVGLADNTRGHGLGSVQAFAAKLLPETAKGRDLLFNWLVRDGKRIDAQALANMWAKWGSMSRRQGLLDRAFVSRAASRRELAEAWLLSPYRPEFSRHAGTKMTFLRLTRDQVLNPDGRVRRSAIAGMLTGLIPTDGFAFLKRLRAGHLLRKRAVADTEEQYREVKRKFTQRGLPGLSELAARRQGLINCLHRQ